MQLRRLTILFLLTTTVCFGQGVRYDNVALKAQNPLTGIKNAVITVCTSAGTGIPCAPLATTYTDATLTTPCPATQQVVLANTSTCVASSDVFGNFGFWLAPSANYIYTITTPGLPGYSTTINVPCPVTGNCSFSGQFSATNPCVIGGMIYVSTGGCYTTLAAAYASVPSQGAFIYDATQETLSVNPFAVCQAVNADVTIFLSTNIISNVAIVNACNGLNIIGTGRSGSVGFTAGGSFPGSSVLFTTTGGAGVISGSRIQDLTLNCSNNTTCQPYAGINIGENSGVTRVAFTNYFAYGAIISGLLATDFLIEDPVFAPSVSATAAGGIKLNGIVQHRNPIRGITCSQTVAIIQSGACVDVENSSAHISDIHPEAIATGVLANNSHVLVEHYGAAQGGALITDNIKLTGTSSAVLLDIYSTTGTNLIKNTTTGLTIPVATTNLMTYYFSGSSAEGEVYFYPGIGVAGETHTGDITASNFIAAKLGATTAQLHTIPSVASDTYALLAASQTLSTKTLTTPTINGITNGTGIQLFSTSTTCSTSGVIDNACTTGAITLPVGYADTNYRLSCTGQGPTNLPIVQTYTKSNTTFTLTIVALTAAVSTFSSYDCSAEHN